MKPLIYYNKLETALKNAGNLEEVQVAWNCEPKMRFKHDRELVREELKPLYDSKVARFSVPANSFPGQMYVFQIAAWFRRKEPSIMREFEGVVVAETPKAYLIHGRYMVSPTGTCRHCGREITHPVSMKYGLGSTCGAHMGIDPAGESVESIRRRLQVESEFEQWIPKAAVEDKTIQEQEA